MRSKGLPSVLASELTSVEDTVRNANRKVADRILESPVRNSTVT